MTRLADKIASLTNAQTVCELPTLLNRKTTVSISWWGQRMVSIEGYQGSVAIDALTRKYLKATPTDANALAGRIQDLYKQSDKELNKTWIYWLILRCLEWSPCCKLCAGDPRAVLDDRVCFLPEKSEKQPDPFKPPVRSIPVKNEEPKTFSPVETKTQQKTSSFWKRLFSWGDTEQQNEAPLIMAKIVDGETVKKLNAEFMKEATSTTLKT